MPFIYQTVGFSEKLRQAIEAQIVAQTAPVTLTTLGSVTIVVALLMAGLSFLITWAIGRPLLAYLKMKKVGKLVREDGPQSHLKKTVTPTMGGLMMLISIVFVSIVFILIPLRTFERGGLSILLPIGIVISCGLLGAI